MARDVENDRDDDTTAAGAHRWRRIALFLYLWLMVGFATGTVVLVGPTRWITAGLRGGAYARWESPVMWGVILLFVGASLALTRWIHARTHASPRALVRIGVPALVTLAAAAAFGAWLDPALLAGLAGGVEQHLEIASGAEFVFGPYPDRAHLALLREEGFTAVVSLQSPAVVPIEPPGIEAERAATSELGIRFIQAPMVPWISDNAEALDTLRSIVKSGRGKYYIHCGLGRDRVSVAKAFIERIGGVRTVEEDGMTEARTFADRTAEQRFLMERGNFQVLEPDLWLVPWPNEKEGFGKLLGGHLRHVTVVMDPSIAEQAAWLEQAERLFRLYEIENTIVRFDASDPRHLADVVRDVRSASRPAAVIVPRTEPCPNAREADAFLTAWESTVGVSRAAILPGAGDPHAEGRPLPCETARS